jgi:hypothetical protein
MGRQFPPHGLIVELIAQLQKSWEDVVFDVNIYVVGTIHSILAAILFELKSKDELEKPFYCRRDHFCLDRMFVPMNLFATGDCSK